MVKFNLLNLCSAFALLAIACLAAPPNALASDYLFIDNQNTTYDMAGDIWPEKGDILALVKPDPGDIRSTASPNMNGDGGSVLIVAELAIITASKMIGSDAAASWGKPRFIH